MSSPVGNNTQEASRKAVADAIHVALTQPSSQESHDEPQQIRRLQNGAAVYHLPGTHSSASSGSVAEINNEEFKELNADFIQATNSAINQLLERVQAQALENVQQPPSKDGS